MAALPKSDVVIVGIGARAPTGMNALQVTMTSRAKKSFPRACHMIDRVGEPIGMCRLGSIGDDVMGLPRFVALAAPAAIQASYAWLALERLMAGLVERITPLEARQHLAGDPSALLVCAYDTQEKCQKNHLEGSISLDELKTRPGVLAKEREIIFYCA